MKKLAFLLSTIVLMLASCSKDSEGLENLLRHIPADATTVAGINVKSTLEKSGCKVDGSKVVVSDELKEILKNDRQLSKVFNIVSTVDAGVKIDWVGVFAMGGKVYILGPIDNEKRFRSYIENYEHAKFSKSGKIETAGNWAIADGYFWTSITSLPADRVEDFSSLPESKSWAAKKYTEKLVEEADDAFAVCDVTSITSLLGNSSQSQLVAMGMGMMFNDLNYIALHVDIEKDGFEIEADMLNSNFTRAEYLLPKVPVDTSVISSITESADVVTAISVPSALVDKFSSLLKLAGEDGDALNAIDGTLAIAYSASEGKGVIQLKDAAAADNVKKMLASNIKNGFSSSMTGNNLFFTFNNPDPVSGNSLKSPAAYFNKALAGFAANATYCDVPEPGYFSLMLVPEDNSVKIKAHLKTIKNPIVVLLGDPYALQNED